jgi:hypothetical protein
VRRLYKSFGIKGLNKLLLFTFDHYSSQEMVTPHNHDGSVGHPYAEYYHTFHSDSLIKIFWMDCNLCITVCDAAKWPVVQVGSYQSVSKYNSITCTGSGTKSAARGVEVPSGVLSLEFNTC